MIVRCNIGLGGSFRRGTKEQWRMNMKTTVKFALAKFVLGLALAGGLALSTVAVSLTGATASFAQQCIPHYDSSGAQTAPYC